MFNTFSGNPPRTLYTTVTCDAGAHRAQPPESQMLVGLGLLISAEEDTAFFMDHSCTQTSLQEPLIGTRTSRGLLFFSSSSSEGKHGFFLPENESRRPRINCLPKVYIHGMSLILPSLPPRGFCLATCPHSCWKLRL